MNKIKTDNLNLRTVMKLTVEERETENKKLDEFLKFAPDYINNLSVGAPGKLSDFERERFADASRFLERELLNRSVRGRKKAAKDEKINEVIELLDQEEITIEQALERLNISQATLYRYWNKNKRNSEAKYITQSPLSVDDLSIFRRLAEGRVRKITEGDIQTLKEGLEIVTKHRHQYRKIRTKNIRKWHKEKVIKYKDVSKIHYSVRLLEADEQIIMDKVEQFGDENSNFKSVSAAIRYYVHLALEKESEK